MAYGQHRLKRCSHEALRTLATFHCHVKISDSVIGNIVASVVTSNPVTSEANGTISAALVEKQKTRLCIYRFTAASYPVIEFK